MIDLTTIHNPYDFANPVSEPDLFVGRKKEMDDIKYYLDHAKTAPRPINIALLGERAAGKTSILNMTQKEAEKRGFLPVRVDLDEDDATSHMAFFFKLFDATLTTACSTGAFEGKTGKTFETYLDMVSAYAVPEEKTFCPFLFPVQYAKAMAAGNQNARVSDTSFKSDLGEIRRELNRPIVIMFDEGNVLAKSQTHLEKLRNIFMNTPGYMLVLTGTPDLFPQIDEVFSPIVRQFQKIQVGRFENKDETRDCIRKPLEKIGVTDVEEIFDFETYNDVREIHDLTGGRPYEVQFLCHVLFRRVQEKRAKKMTLDLSVLEDVRIELESTQDVTARPILTKIRGLDRDGLSALGLFCECDGHSTLEQAWAIDHIFNKDTTWTKERLEEFLWALKNEGIVDVQEGVVKFRGDDFDKIYTKYYAREKKINIHFLNAHMDLLFHFKLMTIFERIDGLGFFTTIMLTPLSEPVEVIATRMGSVEDGGDVFADGGLPVSDLYRLMVRYTGRGHAPVVDVSLSAFGVNAQSILYSKNPSRGSPIGECMARLSILAQRASEIAVQLQVELKEIPVPPLDILAAKVDRTGNEKMREMISEVHHAGMVQAYLVDHDAEKALLHADLFCRFNSSPGAKECNNLGYFFMASGAAQRARAFLEQSIATAEEDHASSLARYNLGILEVKQGNCEAALKLISESVDIAERISPSSRTCECLLIPIVSESSLHFEEKRGDLDLLPVAVQAKETIRSFTDKGK